MVRPLVSSRAFCFATALFIVAFALVSPPLLGAQDLPSSAVEAPAPAHIAFVDGVAILERDGGTDDAPMSMPLLAGDRVRTRGGRVEILFADGATLHLDHNTVIDLQSDELVRLIEGRIRLSIPGPQREVGYRVDGPHGWALIDEPGEYRIGLMNGPAGSELELAVLRGRAELANDGGRTPLRAGERAFVRASAAPSYAFVANSAALDAFDRWSELRRNERLGASAQYLPDEVRPYAAALDQDGYWRDEPTYGRVWYPRVDVDWRPYYRGRWANLRPYGWTWIGHDRWGWPTHHYGRWGFGGSGWFWIPGRSWGAAWVSWASAPGYVSWCPLGWNNQAVFQINVNVGYGYNPWRAWTVLPDRSFGRGYVHRNVVRIDHLDGRTRGSFRVAERAPVPQGYVGPRAATAIRTAGANGGRRPSSPVYSNLPADQGRIRTEGSRIQVPSAGAESRRTASGTPSSSGTRERTMPGRPATRATRPGDSSAGGAVVQRGQEPADRPANDGRRAAPSYNGDRSERVTPGTRRDERAPARVPERAPARAPEPPPERLDRSRSADGARPSSRQAPGYGTERAPSSRGLERAPSNGDAAPPQRVAPRDESQPATGGPRRAPEARGGGPERPSSGSYERRAPERSAPPATQPSAAPRSGGDRPAGGTPGARPRPSGGGGAQGGAPVRRAGGGRTEGQ
ncbi:MAG: FecR domain-containing protein [Acidobacteriota bacterium]|nr:FecR domain-containing protein [Acidobacteriota bacterium]